MTVLLAPDREMGAVKLTYRADIDGLRALAVLAVVGYHTLPRRVPGGFVGVDVFFVLSGYLISGIILAAIDNRVFSYRWFYARRIRRIFPALLIVLASCYAYGWIALLPNEFASLGTHVAAGAGFLSNVVLWHEAGYFDPAAELKPMLHLWSLGVEEQFYIVWPIALVLFRRWPRALLVGVASVGAASFVLNVLLAPGHPVAAFYLPVTRFWELSVGAVLAVLQLRAGGRLAVIRNHQVICNLLAWTGLAALVATILLIDRNRSFPGWWALPPVLATCSIVAAGPRAWPNRIALGGRLPVAIGLVSYPLYLWHWPLLVFGRIVYGAAPPAGLTFVLVCIAFVLASLTYLAIERPIRFGDPRAPVLALLCACLVAVGISGLAASTGRFGAHASDPRLSRILEATNDWSPDLHLKSFVFGKSTIYSAGAEDVSHVLFFGDSNAQQFMPRIVSLLEREPSRYQSAFVATLNGCPPIPDVHERNHPWCPDFVDDVVAFARMPNVRSIVVGACWLCYFVNEGGVGSQYDYYLERNRLRTSLHDGVEGDPRTLAALQQMLTAFALTKKTYLVLNVPSGRVLDPRSMIQRDIWGRVTIATPGLDKNAFLQQYGPLRGRLLEVAEAAGVGVIDPMTELCEETVCASVRNGEPIYMDFAHLRASFAREHVLLFDEIMRRP